MTMLGRTLGMLRFVVALCATGMRLSRYALTALSSLTNPGESAIRMMRPRSLLLVVAVGAILVAVPTGLGAKPVRTVFHGQEPYVIPAGVGCPFDVRNAPVGWFSITEFSDGRTVTYGHGDVTMTNLETGTSYFRKSRFVVTDTFTDATTLQEVIDGRVNIQFFPGDQGPFGEIGENGGWFAFVGTVTLTLDLDTLAYTSFSYQGTVTDLCEILAA